MQPAVADVFEEFLRRAVHDLRGPMGQVHALTALLARQHGSALEEDGQKLCAHIESAAKRAIEVIDALQAYSEFLSPPVFDNHDMNAIVDSVFGMPQLSAGPSGLVATHDVLPGVRGDREKLVYLFRELVTNTIKFRGAAMPAVHVGAQHEGAFVNFVFSDNGPGVTDGKAEVIFEPLRRLHGREYPGAGIGLAICRRIVEMHGGQIRAESGPEGGTRIIFSLPAAR